MTAEHARIGMDKDEIDTPAALIDLDALDRNIEKVASYYRSKKGAALRPHQKGHRLPMIARKQLDAGAKGLSMTSYGLAEYYASCGFKDILVTSEVTGAGKIARLAGQSRHSDITVGVDNLDNARQLSDAGLSIGAKIKVAVELLMSPASCGVEIPDAKPLVREIVKLQGVDFRGFWWHEGALGTIRSWTERKAAHFETLEKVARLKDEVEDAGVSVELLSGGHTCSWNITPEYAGLSNVGVQAGSYVFSDWCSHETEGVEVFEHALTVLARCISRPKPDRAMFDFGLNSCSDEHTDYYRKIVGPQFKELQGVKEVYEREEIALVVFDGPREDPKVGDALELVPPHSDTTAKLYDRYYCIRNNRLEAVWPNYGRGLL